MKIFIGSCLCLWQIFSDQVSAQGTRKDLVASTGSSVLFPGTDTNFKYLNWEFSNPSRTLPITEVDQQHTIVFEKYKNRIEVHLADGSFLLKDVGQADIGQYIMTVDLEPKRTRILTLKVFDSLPVPFISCTHSPENHTTMLTCWVESGKATSILWTKDAEVLPVDPRQLLSDGNMTLIIWSSQTSDSGYYTCRVENLVSWNHSTYHLVIVDPEPQLRSRYGLFPAAILLCTVVVLNIRFAFGSRR
ncbi:hepatic and glial cell adhesion molecule-like [Narcine bancroftii]|uniref:hepatic and glial cell adhesion molecule-like n=1 Tax=Narcine bancroftii TaxID=1343680 RepID=UPI003831E343